MGKKRRIRDEDELNEEELELLGQEGLVEPLKTTKPFLEENEEVAENEENFEKEELQAYLDLKSEQIKKNDIVNKDGLLSKLKEFKFDVTVPWVETLAVTTPNVVSIQQVHDDKSRELAFYKQALESVEECQQRMDEIKLLYRRPQDYFAEMIKSDEHMAKVKQHLISEKQRIEQAEGRRKQRELKKFGKQIQVQRQLEKQKTKKDQLEQIKKWRKDRQSGIGSEDLPLGLDDENKNRKNQNQNQSQKKNPNKSQASKKRKFKDEKFGYGGKKKRLKTNDKNSFAQNTGWSVSKNRQVPNNLKKKLPKHKQRPGKNKRNNKQKK